MQVRPPAPPHPTMRTGKWSFLIVTGRQPLPPRGWLPPSTALLVSSRESVMASTCGTDDRQTGQTDSHAAFYTVHRSWRVSLWSTRTVAQAQGHGRQAQKPARPAQVSPAVTEAPAGMSLVDTRVVPRWEYRMTRERRSDCEQADRRTRDGRRAPGPFHNAPKTQEGIRKWNRKDVEGAREAGTSAVKREKRPRWHEGLPPADVRGGLSGVTRNSFCLRGPLF